MGGIVDRDMIEGAFNSAQLAHRQRLQQLEAAMIASGETVELELHHWFAHGTYTRALVIPKGTLLTGKIHRFSCINILSKGSMLISTEDGEFEMHAPEVFVSPAGGKKGGLALEDSIWINVHPWDGPDDADLIEQQFIIPEQNALEEGLRL